MFLALALCIAVADDGTFNGLKTAEWIAMSKDDPIPRKRKAAVIALGQLVTEKSRDKVLTAVARAMRSDSQASVRLQAILVLGQQPAEFLAAYIPDLTEGLRDEKDAQVKREQAVALGRLGKAAQAAVLPLIDALSGDAKVKVAAAEALGRIGSGANASAPALLPLVNDPDRAVRNAAVFALGRVDPADPDAVVAALVKLLADLKVKHAKLVPSAALTGGGVANARESDLVAAAVVSISLLGVKTNEVVRALAEQVGDPDAEVRLQTVLALGKLTVAARAAEAELKVAARRDSATVVRVYAIHALAAANALEPEPLISFLGECLKADPEPDVRIAIVQELGGMGAKGTAGLGILREAQRDTQVKVREAAKVAIRRITKPVQSEKP